MMKHQVVIIGSGPAGLILGALLGKAGIDNIIVEHQSQEHVLSRIRAGVLEDSTVQVLREIGVTDRLDRQGLRHTGFSIGFSGHRLRIDLEEATGRHVTVYGQTEVTRDLMDARSASGMQTIYDAQNVSLQDFDGSRPRVTYEKDGRTHEISCDFIAGCDGSHGISHQSIPASAIQTFERSYPFGWLGVLADVPPCAHELVYSSHERGFALCSMRSPTRSRYYIQCGANENADSWSGQAFWDELRRRLSPDLADAVVTGPVIEKSIAPLRSFVSEPLRFGRLFLAGDAAHIVPPTGAKGLNLAAGDAWYLAQAFKDFYLDRSNAGIDHYSQRALARVWNAERFSWWMTSFLHRFDQLSPFEKRMQQAEYALLEHSERARAALAENYVGMPF